MPGINIREGDSLEASLKKFKKQCEKAGILSEVRKREAHEKPSVKRKKKDVAARKRLTKKARPFSRG
jgi:small subunit ribosomal protein S21